jgi:hypothetical protein
MPDVVIYDPNTNYVLEHRTNQFSSEYQGLVSSLSFETDPDINYVRGLFESPGKDFLIRDQNTIRPMTPTKMAVRETLLKQSSSDLFPIKELRWRNKVTSAGSIVLSGIRAAEIRFFAKSYFSCDSGNVRIAENGQVGTEFFSLSLDHGELTIKKKSRSEVFVHLEIIYA